jgi:hypothetical protein
MVWSMVIPARTPAMVGRNRAVDHAATVVACPSCDRTARNHVIEFRKGSSGFRIVENSEFDPTVFGVQ